MKIVRVPDRIRKIEEKNGKYASYIYPPDGYAKDGSDGIETLHVLRGTESTEKGLIPTVHAYIKFNELDLELLKQGDAYLEITFLSMTLPPFRPGIWANVDELLPEISENGEE